MGPAGMAIPPGRPTGLGTSDSASSCRLTLVQLAQSPSSLVLAGAHPTPTSSANERGRTGRDPQRPSRCSEIPLSALPDAPRQHPQHASTGSATQVLAHRAPLIRGEPAAVEHPFSCSLLQPCRPSLKRKTPL